MPAARGGQGGRTPVAQPSARQGANIVVISFVLIMFSLVSLLWASCGALLMVIGLAKGGQGSGIAFDGFVLLLPSSGALYLIYRAWRRLHHMDRRPG